MRRRAPSGSPQSQAAGRWRACFDDVALNALPARLDIGRQRVLQSLRSDQTQIQNFPPRQADWAAVVAGSTTA
jgi:hypothetical protein